MGIWIEFRCENRSNPSAAGSSRGRCESHNNNGPMEMARETNDDVLDALRYLGNEARKGGWKRTRYGWICAHCASQPTVLTELKASWEESGDE